MFGREKTACCLVFVVAVAVYSSTMAPCVQFGDNAEFATAGWSLGISHNPGYPFHAVTGHFLCRFCPFGAIDYRVNLMSALLGALGAVLVVIILRQHQIPLTISAGTALVYAFNPSVWSQAGLAEVYTADSLMILIYLSLIGPCRRDRRISFILAFSMVFGLSVHLSHILYMPAILIVLFLSLLPVIRCCATWMVTALAFLSGALIWAYLPIRATQSPVLNTGDPDTLLTFFQHAAGAVHRRHAIMNMGTAATFDRIPEFFQKCFFSVFPWPILAVCLVGIACLFVRNRRFALVMVWIALANIGYAVFLNQVPFDATPFGLPLASLTAVWFGFGAAGLVRFQAGRGKPAGWLYPLAPAAALFLVVTQFSIQDRSRDMEPYFFGRAQQDPLPEKSALLARSDDDVFIGMYLQKIERRRPDIEWIDATGSTGTGPVRSMSKFRSRAAFFAAYEELLSGLTDQTGGRVFYCFRHEWGIPVTGLLYSWNRSGETGRLADFLTDQVLVLKNDVRGKDFQFRRKLAQIHLIRAYRALLDQSEMTMNLEIERALQIAWNIAEIDIELAELLIRRNLPDPALQRLEEAKLRRPSNEAIYYWMSQAYQQKGDRQKAEEAFEKYRSLLGKYFIR